MKQLDVIVILLLALAGINWGLIGIFDFNLVEFIFRSSRIDRIIYVLTGLAGLYQIFGWNAICKRHRKK